MSATPAVGEHDDSRSVSEADWLEFDSEANDYGVPGGLGRRRRCRRGCGRDVDGEVAHWFLCLSIFRVSAPVSDAPGSMPIRRCGSRRSWPMMT